MLDLLNTLINEHGSSTILKERLGLVADQYAALERRNADLEKENQQIALELEQVRARLRTLQSQLDSLQSAHGKLVCDHCGSPSIVRVGSRPHAIFGDVGLKQAVYRCEGCGGQTLIDLPG